MVITLWFRGSGSTLCPHEAFDPSSDPLRVVEVPRDSPPSSCTMVYNYSIQCVKSAFLLNRSSVKFLNTDPLTSAELKIICWKEESHLKILYWLPFLKNFFIFKEKTLITWKRLHKTAVSVKRRKGNKKITPPPKQKTVPHMILNHGRFWEREHTNLLYSIFCSDISESSAFNIVAISLSAFYSLVHKYIINNRF